MREKAIKVVTVFVAVTGLFVLANVAIRKVLDYPWIPQPTWNDRYQGEWYTVIQSVPVEDVVDRQKIEKMSGENARFFAKNGNAHDADHKVYCTMLNERAVQQSVPVEEVVDWQKIEKMGGENARFFAKNGSAHDIDHKIYCVILKHR